MTALHTQQLNTTSPTYIRRISTLPHANTHPSIHSHFAPKARRNNRKAPTSPPTPQRQAEQIRSCTLYK